MEILGSRILVRPRDFERSLGFYRDQLGLAVYREFAGGRGVVFFLGGGFLELSGSGAGVGADGAELWLQVRSAEAAHRQLREAGVAIEEAPVDKPWGLRELRVRDPDGRRLIFVEVPEDHPLRRDPRSS